VAPRHATCLDLAVVLAWACLTAELRPIIVVVEPSGAVSRTRWCWFGSTTTCSHAGPARSQSRRAPQLGGDALDQDYGIRASGRGGAEQLKRLHVHGDLVRLVELLLACQGLDVHHIVMQSEA
jgi:hypothetical protein